MVIYISIFLIDLSIRNAIIMDTTPLSSVTKGKEKERGLPWKAVVVSVTICYSCFTVCSIGKSLYLLHTVKIISIDILFTISMVLGKVGYLNRVDTNIITGFVLLYAINSCPRIRLLCDMRVRVLVVTRAPVCSRSIYSLFSSNLYDLDRTLIP